MTFSNYNVLVTSSALDRTLLSARSFITGDCPSPLLRWCLVCLVAQAKPVACSLTAGRPLAAPQACSRTSTCRRRRPTERSTCRMAPSRCPSTRRPAPTPTTFSSGRTQSALLALHLRAPPCAMLYGWVGRAVTVANLWRRDYTCLAVRNPLGGETSHASPHPSRLLPQVPHLREASERLVPLRRLRREICRDRRLPRLCRVAPRVAAVREQ